MSHITQGRSALLVLVHAQLALFLAHIYHTYLHAISYTQKNHVTHMNESCDTETTGTAVLVHAQLALYLAYIYHIYK